MRHVLVVANQTLGGQELLATVQERLDSGPAEFWIVVPATAATDDRDMALLGPGGSGAGSIVESPAHSEDAYQAASRRLQEALAQLASLGAPVDGEVGADDPLHAIEEALARRDVDEIIISTLPTHLSRWLHTDLPSRAQRKFDLPVTTVTARGDSRH
jgi:hypothetical protein